jgi:hypothetical protein
MDPLVWECRFGLLVDPELSVPNGITVEAVLCRSIVSDAIGLSRQPMFASDSTRKAIPRNRPPGIRHISVTILRNLAAFTVNSPEGR